MSVQDEYRVLFVKGIQLCEMTSYPEPFFPTISCPITRAHRADSANSRAMIP